MTVSWSAPGAQPQPSPSLVYRPGPLEAGDGDPATVRTRSFVDGANGEIVHAYHAGITGLAPATRYHYRISDGATPPNTFGGTFTTAVADGGRAPWAFTSFGDLSTPTAAHNASATTWKQSSDNAFHAVSAILAESQEAHGVAPVMHLLNGDLCYANLNPGHQPAVWRDFTNNIQRSASLVAWMPCLGNHEVEFGGNGRDGTGPGWWNGPYGYGQYQTRFELPDNGVSGHRGHWYSFQIGTVLFIALDADDVIYQDSGAVYAPPDRSPLVTPVGVSVPAGSSLYNNQYSGALAAGADDSLVPDETSPHPNQQTIWLRRTLEAARRRPNELYPGKLPVDMIVVQMHQCALSSSLTGNGSDLGLRRAWLPLFDEYGVDLVVSGHEHNYERSHAVRGYNRSPVGTVVAPNPGQAPAGAPMFTRQPVPVPSARTVAGGLPAFDTSQGTVYLVLGGGGTDSPTNVYGTDAGGHPQAKVITERTRIYPSASGGFAKSSADSVEPAPWSAQRDVPSSASTPGYAYGYARFDVSPGSEPGDTTIVMSYWHAPRTGAGTSYVGATSYSLLEQVAYGRNLVANPPKAMGSEDTRRANPPRSAAERS